MPVGSQAAPGVEAWLLELLMGNDARCEFKPLPRGSVLFESGTEVVQVHVVLTGRIKVIAHNDDGKIVNVEMVGPKSWLGEAALDGQHTMYAYSATADIDSSVGAFRRVTFKQLIAENPPLSDLFVEGVARHISAMDHVMHDNMIGGTERKVARWLQGVARDLPGKVMPLAITPQRLATMFGVARQTGVNVLERLVEIGVLTKQRTGHYLVNKDTLDKFVADRMRGQSWRKPKPKKAKKPDN